MLFKHKHVGLRVLRYTLDKVVEHDNMPSWFMCHAPLAKPMLIES